LVCISLLVANANQSEAAVRAGARPSFAVERECDADVDFLSLQVVEDGLQRLTFERYAVASPNSQFLDDLEVRVVFDTRDEPAVVLVDTVKQPEIVEAQIKEYKGARHLLAGG